MPDRINIKGKRSKPTVAIQRERNWPPVEAIQERAYELYVNRGKQPGHELEDWLQAERELKEKQAGR
jgi:hypothetical protein